MRAVLRRNAVSSAAPFSQRDACRRIIPPQWTTFAYNSCAVGGILLRWYRYAPRTSQFIGANNNRAYRVKPRQQTIAPNADMLDSDRSFAIEKPLSNFCRRSCATARTSVTDLKAS